MLSLVGADYEFAFTSDSLENKWSSVKQLFELPAFGIHQGWLYMSLVRHRQFHDTSSLYQLIAGVRFY
jgi:hypothetical protein